MDDMTWTCEREELEGSLRVGREGKEGKEDVLAIDVILGEANQGKYQSTFKATRYAAPQERVKRRRQVD